MLILTFTLNENHNNSITLSNIYKLADDIKSNLNGCKGRIHFFFAGPNNLVFIIGKLMDKESNINIYETLKYPSEIIDGEIYTDAIRIG